MKAFQTVILISIICFVFPARADDWITPVLPGGDVKDTKSNSPSLSIFYITPKIR